MAKKRRSPGEGCIYKRKLPSGRTVWRGSITVGYKPDGKPIRRTAQRNTQAEVVEALAKHRAKFKGGALDLSAEATMRLHAMLDRWVAHYEAIEQPKRRTLNTYRWAIAHAKTALGDRLLRTYTPASIQQAITGLNGTMSRSSLNLIKVVVQGAFRQALIWRILADDPAAGLQIPRDRSEAAPRRILTEAEASAYVAALLNERNGLMVVLTYAVALRPSEAVALHWAEIQWGGDGVPATLTVARAHRLDAGVGVQDDTTKSKSGRRVLPLSESLVRALRTHQARQRSEATAMGERWPAYTGELVFVRPSDGGKLPPNAVYGLGRKVAEAQGLGTIGPRILRRSMLSHLARQGANTKVRAAIGGHTEEVTNEHYHEVLADEIAEAMHLLRDVLPASEEVE
jgi:integrase